MKKTSTTVMLQTSIPTRNAVTVENARVADTTWRMNGIAKTVILKTPNSNALNADAKWTKRNTGKVSAKQKVSATVTAVYATAEVYAMDAGTPNTKLPRSLHAHPVPRLPPSG